MNRVNVGSWVNLPNLHPLLTRHAFNPSRLTLYSSQLPPLLIHSESKSLVPEKIFEMASLALPSPPLSSLLFRRRLLAPTIPVQNTERSNGKQRFSVIAAASGVVTVDKSEAETVHRLKSVYLEKVVPRLKEEFSYTNVHEVPKIEKVVVNCGIGDATQNSRGLEDAMKDLALITGQRPVKTRARLSIASFKVREGQTVGIAVTLRGKEMPTEVCYILIGCHSRAFQHEDLLFASWHTQLDGLILMDAVMYAFLDRLVNLGLPRTRDFQGVNPNSFDGRGNYSIGIREQSVFPEIRHESLGKHRGMDVCITTTAKSDNEAQRLLALMGMPFQEGRGPTVVIRKKKLKAHHFDSKAKGRRK
ncbi:60S ribosomal protein L5 [Asimina triloba]